MNEPGESSSVEPVEIAARDGYRLSGTLFRPQDAAAGAVAIYAATGVRQEYYAHFAAYLAARGFIVLTFDYRGIGRSRRGSLRGFAARMRDWAELDGGGALDFLQRSAGDAKLFAIGHSFGGNGFGVINGIERYAAALFVGAQSGYWRHWRGAGRAGMWFLTHLLLPVVAPLLGYFPARLLGQGEDLPAGVATEWARWCRDPRYAAGALGSEGYTRFSSPIRSYWIADDSYAPLPAAEALLRLYPAAASELKRISPADVGAGRIGHFGFFREQFRDSLWRNAADWLLAS
jgi:predicted alpha/beta hydrolase